MTGITCVCVCVCIYIYIYIYYVRIYIYLYIHTYISPRYLTPPDLNACGDRVLVSMEDKTIGMHITHMHAQARSQARSLFLPSFLPPSSPALPSAPPSKTPSPLHPSHSLSQTPLPPFRVTL